MDLLHLIRSFDFAKQYNRLNTVRKLVKNCSLDGVEIGYDWFYNKLKKDEGINNI